MASKATLQVETTGGQVDIMVMALIDAANDKDPKVRQIIGTSLLELGKKQSSLVLTSSLSYLHKYPKLSQNHRITILSVMESIIKQSVDSITKDLAIEVIKQASIELTSSKEVIPDWQTAASTLLVALGTKFCNEVMDELLQKFLPGVLPHFFVVETMANLSSANVFGMLPFLKSTLGSMLPMLGLAKAENMRWAFSNALAKFCEAILDYVANIEKAPDPSVRKEAFEAEVNSAFEVLLNVWLNSREPKLRVAVVDALGQMSQVMSQQKLQEHLVKLLQSLLTLYKKHAEAYHVTQGLCMVLDAATVDANIMLEPHFDMLMNSLFPQICQSVDYNNPLTVKNHNEVLRCFAVLARSFSDKVVAILIQKLEQNNDKIRMGVLAVLRHLINSAVPYMENKKDLLLSGVKILLQDPSNKVKKVLAQTVIAMAHHNYLELEGGQLMIEFIVRQCALPAEAQGKRPTDPEYVSNDALRSMCDNVLQLLSTTVDGMDKVLWPSILEYVVMAEYSGAITVISQTTSHIAGKKREETSVDLEINFNDIPNIPRPPALLARFLVLAGHPSKNKNRGKAILQALRNLGPVLNDYISSLWDSVIPKLMQHLEEAWASEENWNQKSWEDLLLKFLSKTLDQISDEEWFGNLSDALVHQIPLYTDLSEEKNFLYKCLGLTLKKCGRKSTVSTYLDAIFQTMRHNSQIEREGCAIAAGFTGSAHLDTVLSKLEVLGKFDTSKRSSGLFGFIKDSVSTRSDLDEKTRATVMLSYGYVTLYAPSDLIVSRLEAVIARVILPQFDHVKDPQVKLNLILSVELIAKAMHPEHLNQSHTFTLRNRLLQNMQSFIKAEKPKQLTNEVRASAMNAAASLVKLDPILPETEVKELVGICLDSVMSLPPGGSPNRKLKEETYQEHVEAERLVESTFKSLQELLTQVVMKDLTPGGLERVLHSLHDWSRSMEEFERMRAVNLMNHLLFIHLTNVDPVQAGSTFSSMGTIVGWIVPRCSDPNVVIRMVAVEAMHCVFKIAFKYEGKGTEHKDPLVDALPTLKSRLDKNDSTSMFNVINDLAKVIHKKTAPDQLMPLLDSLLEGLLDQQAFSSSGSCVVLNSVIKARGGELHSQVQKLCCTLVEKVKDITAPQTHTATLRCFRTLASHHLLIVVDFLLDQPLPLEHHVEECWHVLGQDDSLMSRLLDHLLDSLNRILPYEEKPDPRIKDTTLRIATVQSMRVVCGLTQLCHTEEVSVPVLNNYPRLLSAMLMRIASCVGAKAPKVTKEEQRDPKVVTVTKEVPVDPCRSAILGCQQVIRAFKSQEFLMALDMADVWSKMESEDNFIEGFTLFARFMVQTQPQFVSKVTTCLFPSLGSVYDPQRVATAAVFSEFVAFKCAGDLTQVEMLTNNFLGRLVDTNLKVRMLCVRGLGNISSAGPDQVQKFATTILSAMMSGMDDKDDQEDEITLEAMEGLSKILEQIEETHIRAILINVALRIRPCFEKEKEAVRAAAVSLFGNLSRFGDGPSKGPFLEQIHTNLVSLLLHLHDPEPEVVKACKLSLQQLGPLIGSQKANEMFQKHLIDGGTLHYGEFINDLTKELIKDFPEKSNFFVMGAVNFFKSNWPEIRSNAAMFAGFLLGNMPKEMYTSLSREHICNALVMLLKDSTPEVRIKAAEAMSWLYDI